MSTHKELALRLIECFSRTDIRGIDRLISDSVKHTAGGADFSTDLQGRAAYLEYMGERLFPRFRSLHFEAYNVIEDVSTGTVVVEWRGSFVTSAGKPYTNRGAFVIECHDGRISWVRDYFDTLKTKEAMS